MGFNDLYDYGGALLVVPALIRTLYGISNRARPAPGCLVILVTCPYLNLSHLPGALHPGRHVDRIAPDVVLRLLRAHHPGHHATLVQPGAELEPLEAVAVDVLQEGAKLNEELHQDGAVVVLPERLVHDYYELLSILILLFS